MVAPEGVHAVELVVVNPGPVASGAAEPHPQRRFGHQSIEGASKVDHPFYLTRETARGYFATAGLDVLRERSSDDGHWGFLLERGRAGEPDWVALAIARDRFLDQVWRTRAVGR